MSGLWREARPLILASKSSARRGVLVSAGLPIEAIPADIDERALDAPLIARGAPPTAVAAKLARAKALAVSGDHPGRLVVGADQTLSLDGRRFNKPEDLQAAAAQLAAFSGRTHALHSAFCVARDGAVLFAAAPTARLTCRTLSADFIATYLDVAGPVVLGSVGAYQLEGLGAHLFSQVEGDHSTILGLPIMPLLAFLREVGAVAS